MAYDAGSIDATLELDRTPFQRGLREARAAAERFEQGDIEPRVVVETNAARAELRRLSAVLNQLDRDEANPDVHLQTAAFRVELARIRQDLRDLDREDVNVDVDVGRGVMERVTALSAGIGGLVGSVANVGDAAADAGGGMAGLGGSMTSAGGAAGGMGARMAALGGAVGALVVVAAAAVVGLAALTASFGAAVAGAAALGVALVASLGPALIVIGAVASRIAAVMGAKQAQEQAAAQATRGSANASNEAAQAMEREYQAAVAVRDAREGLARAHRQYGQAVAQAREDIREAGREEQEAHERVVEAARDYARAQESAERARKDAAEAVIDAADREQDAEERLVRTRRDSARDIDRANQAVVDAYERVAQAAEEADRASRDASRNLRDANLDQREAQEAAADAAENVTAAEAELDRLRRLGGGPRAIARAEDELAEARLAQERANNRLTDSAVDLADAQQTANDFAEKGRDAYDPYTAAVQAAREAVEAQGLAVERAGDQVAESVKAYDEARAALLALQNQGIDGAPQVVSAIEAERSARDRLGDAKRDEAEAQREAEEARRQGVRNNPAVIAAADGLRDANQRLAQAQHQAREAARQNAADIGAAGGAAAIAAQKVAELSAEERRFLNTVKDVAQTFRTVMQPATDAVLAGMTGAVRTLEPTFRSLQPAFTVLGQAFGRVLLGIAATLASLGPEFDLLIRSTAELAVIGGGAFGELLTIMLRIANAAMPLLISGARSVERALGAIAERTRDTEGLRSVIGGLVSHLESWLRLIGAVSNVFLAFFAAAAPAGKGLVDSLARGADHLAEWMRSAEGSRRLQRFFADTLPLVGALAEMFGVLFVVGMQVFQALAPVLKPVVDQMSALLRVVGLLAELFSKIPEPIREVIGQIIAFATPLTAAIALFGLLGGAAGPMLDAVRGAFRGIRSAISSVWDWMPGAARTAWGATRNVVVGAADGIRDGVLAIWRAIRSGTGSVWGGISGAITGAMRTMVRGVGDGLDGIVDFFGDLPRNISRAVGGFGNMLVQGGSNLVTGLWNGIAERARWFWEKVKDFFGKLRDLLPFSEPRDPSSPLRGLGRSGQAIIENIAAGVDRNSGRLAGAVRSAAMVAPLGAPALALGGVGGAAGPGNTYVEKIEVVAPAGGYPDAKMAARYIGDALQNQGHSG